MSMQHSELIYQCIDREELNILTWLEFDTRKNMEPYNYLFYDLNCTTCSKLQKTSYFQWRQNGKATHFPLCQKENCLAERDLVIKSNMAS